MTSQHDNLRAELHQLLSSFEKMVGLAICIRFMSRRWHEPDGWPVLRDQRFLLHRSPFCMQAKDRDLPACMRDDRSDLVHHLFGADPEVDAAEVSGWQVALPVLSMGQAVTGSDRPVVRRCHAGADEILVPIRSQGQLVAVIFMGQFIRASHEGATHHGLQVLDDHALVVASDMGVLLRSYLVELLGRLEVSMRQPDEGRRGEIERYIREHLSGQASLAGLADRLSLSPSRASHLVKEVTGQSFQSLLEERRLAVACDLLVAGTGKIAWVASQAGFAETGYFCRYFKRKTGMTPGAYRRRYQPHAAV